MNVKDLIGVVIAIALFYFECILLYHISSVLQYLLWHSLVILVVAIYVYWVYYSKGNLLYPLLLLASALMSGPFGLGMFVLIVILRPVFVLFASPASIWFEDLFPEQKLSLFDKVVERIKSHWDDYSEPKDISSFQDLFTFGSVAVKQKVLDTIIENFDPSYSPILKEALKDPQNIVRIQAAAIVTKIDTDFMVELKRLEKLHSEFPKDLTILLKLAEHADAYAFVGILDDLRRNDISSLAVKYYRSYLQSKPDNIKEWVAVARLLFYQKDYESLISWYSEGIEKFGFLPEIFHSWYLESLYKLKYLEEFKAQLREI